MTDHKKTRRPTPGWQLNEAGRLLIRWGRAHLDLSGTDIERGARAVRTDPHYRNEVARAALSLVDRDQDLRRRVIEARDLLGAQPLPYGDRCNYGFPLPSWAGKDQMDPCRCDLHRGHDGPHECEHTRAEAPTAEILAR